jgi:lipopolysaccharide biosynthesis protein
MKAGELDKIAAFVREKYTYRHEKYDFGSWQELIYKIGWAKVGEYDELILCNDSCFGPLFPLLPIFLEMEGCKCDFWGLTKNTHRTIGHIQSYFLVFNRNVFQSSPFKKFIQNIQRERCSQDVILNYEIRLTELLQNHGFFSMAYVGDLKPAPQNGVLLRWRDIVKLGHPFLKIKIFTSLAYEKYTKNLPGLEQFISRHSQYDTNFIKAYLNSYRLGDRNGWQYRVKRFFARLKKFLYQNTVTSNGYHLIKICKIPVWHRKVW